MTRDIGGCILSCAIMWGSQDSMHLLLSARLWGHEFLRLLLHGAGAVSNTSSLGIGSVTQSIFGRVSF
jgi:hypothetical protein